jgi:hypothetical protein
MFIGAFKMQDLIKNDPFFSQVEKMVDMHGFEKAREMLGAETINIYVKLLINRKRRTESVTL